MLRTELIRPLPQTLLAHAERYPDKIAFRDARRAVGYAELEQRTGRLAGHLAALRLQPGDRAAIYLGNSVETVESYLAIARAAAIGVPLNPRSTDAELAHFLDDSGARVVITDPAHLDQLRRLLATRPHVRVVLTEVEIVPGDAPDGTVAFAALAATEPPAPARDDLGLDDVAWMLYTSGTTGKPKGVLSTQRNCLWSVAACYVPVPGLSAEDRVVWPLPLFHSLAHIVCVLGVTSVGATARILDGFSAEDILDALREERATFLAGVPTMYHYLVAAAREQGFEAPELRMCLVGGAITTAALRREFEQVFGAPLLDAYGSTETCGSITINWPTGARVEGSCGLPVPGLGVRVVDPESLTDVPAGAEGEVWVRGPSVMLGYHNQPEATAAALRDGWYRTGDLARRDEAGYFTITGRIKELIIRGGENIHPAEVEEVLRSVPGVADVAVAGRPHDVLGEVPVAYVVPGPGGVDAALLFETCRERLSYFKIPEELYEIARVPRTASGKVKRLALLDRPARLLGVGGALHETLFATEWTPLPTTADPADAHAVTWAVVGETGYADAAALLAALDAGTDTPDLVVLRHDGDAGDAADRVRLLSAQLTALASAPGLDGARLLLLTRHGVATGEDGDLDLSAAPLWGHLRSAQGAYPGRLSAADHDGRTPFAAALALLAHADQPQAALRRGVLLVPRLTRVPNASGTAVHDPQGTVVVIGAGQRAAATVARHLASTHGARRFLLAGDGDPAVADLAEDLARAGATVSTAGGADPARLLDGLPDGRHTLLYATAAPDAPDDELVRAAVTDATGLLAAGPAGRTPALVLIVSSAAGQLGAAARPAEAAAAAVLDTAAAHRSAAGLPTVALSLGGWPRTAGPAANPPGFRALPTAQALAMLDLALAAPRPVLLAARLDAGTLPAGEVPAVLRDLVESPARPAAADDAVTAALRARLDGQTPAQQHGTLLDLVRDEAAAVGGLTGAVPGDRPFKELGFTSLSAVQLRGRLTGVTGLRLPATLAFDHPTPQAVARFLHERLFGTPATPVVAAPRRSAADEPIAIVGMACRAPGGVTSPAQLWDLVTAGIDAVSDFPTDRGWDVAGLYDPDPDAPGKTYLTRGGFLHEAGEFDAGFFGISPREALATDPQQRLLLEVAWEAFEHAGIDPTALKGAPVGVFAGVMYREYGTNLDRAPEGAEGYLGIGNAASVVTGRVAYTLGLEGPAITVDTACSSSLVALHLAAQSLRSGECDMALAGGVAVMAAPSSFIEFSRQRGLAADGRCKAYGEGADGTVWSEGAGLLVVERMSDALAKGHRILAVVRGTAVNQDGASNGLTAPNGPSQQRVINAALASAGLSTSDVDLIEGHGTGTSLGDPIEAQALLATYGQARSAGDPVWLGSLKSNIGHAQAAAGVLGVIKVVEALRRGVLPATLHADVPTGHVDWSAGQVELLQQARPWPERDRPRRGAVSSFGVSGTNAHVVIEQVPVADATGRAESAALPPAAEKPLPLVLSARSETALQAQAARLADVLDTAGEQDRPSLRDAAWTLTRQRAAHSRRAVLLAPPVEGDPGAGSAAVVERLRAFAAGDLTGLVTGEAAGGKVGVLFTGQGAQRVGMGRGLYEAFPVFTAAFDAAVSELDTHLGRSLKKVVFEESAGLLDRTEFTQPALFAVEVATFRLLESWGLRPDLVIGHSIGELAAAHVAGVLALPDAARLVVARGRLMQALPEGGAMVAVQAAEAEALAAIDAAGVGATVEVGAVNAPNSVVVSGVDADVAAVADRLAADGRRIRRLTVSHAFHSPLMDPILDEFEQVVRSVTLHEPQVGFVSTVTGETVKPADLTDPAYWLGNIRRPVRFADAVTAAHAQGVVTFLEVGPGGVLTGLAQQIIDDPAVGLVAALRHDTDEASTAVAAAAGLHVRGHDVDWSALTAGGAAVELPTYPFQRQRFWLHAGGGASDATALGLDSVAHPLLGAATNLPDSDGVLLTGRISLAAQPWLAEHAVAGQVVVPGAALVELAVRAGDEVGATAVEELVIEAPLVLPPTTAVNLQVTVGESDEQGRRPVAVHARHAGADADTPWRRHATGVLSAATAPEADADTVWPPAGAEPVDLDGFYARRAREGVAYGPSFQGLRAVWIRGDEVFAEVALPDGIRDDAGRFGLHPALLDAALHATGFGAPGAALTSPLALPFAWTGVRLHAAGATALRVRATATGPDTVAVAVTDPAGAPVATVDALTFRAAATPTGPAQENLYRFGWTTVPTPDSDTRTWAVLGDSTLLPQAPRHTTVAAAVEAVPQLLLVDLTAPSAPAGPRRGRELTVAALTALQQTLAEPRLSDTRLVLVTRGAVAVHHVGEADDPAAAAVWGLARSAQTEEPDRIVLVDVDGTAESAQALPAAAATGEPQLAVRAGVLSAPRLTRADTGELTPPDTLAWRLDTTGPTFDDLVLAPSPEAAGPLATGQVRIAVRAAGVNFRDVLVSLGMVPGQTGLGGEAAGVVLEVGSDVTDLRAGDRVMGMLGEFGGFGPVAVTDRRLVARLPEGWTFEQGATVPIVFLTAYYGLRDLAGLRSGEKILINAAAGGVGLAAVQLARHLGAHVYGTASPAKWPALTALGVEQAHLASSRTTGFAERFLAATGGSGVDVVLNSLSGEFADASLSLQPGGGRFLELGKTDVRDPAEVAAAYPGVAYQVYDLREAGPDRIGELLADLVGLFESGVLTPLPVAAWDVRRAPDAFRFLSQARHVGKVALTVAPALDPDGTVLISGGGALGGLVARELAASHGVRRLLLASRRGPAADGVDELVADLAALGTHADVVACDLSDRDAVAALLAGVPAVHPLTAVVHTAGIIDDGVIAALDPARVDAVFAPKADAAWHLHELTAGLDLAAFVLFSSAAGVFGNPGQGNYAAANGFLDGLARLRRAQGLPATSLAWGFWSYTSNLTAGLGDAALQRNRRDGMLGIDAAEGGRLLGAGLRAADAVLVPARLDLAGLRARAAAEPVPPLLRSLVRPARRSAQATSAVQGGLAAKLAGLPAAEQERQLVELVRLHAATVLGHADADVLAADRAFKETGFDSLTAVELRNRLATAAGVRLSATVVFDHPTPAALARHLREELTGTEPAAVAAAPVAVAAPDEPIAIVSMSCRFPAGVETPEQLWELLAAGAEVVSDFPADRGWDLDRLFDPDPDHAGTSYVRRGGFLDGMAEFDADFFGISPREATAMDPQQRLLLETSWEAFERAGIDPSGLRGRSVGVFTGVINHDYSVRVHQAPGDLEGYRLTGVSGSVASGRVAYTLGLEGPAITVDTACSSSLVALHLAAQALRAGECDMALAGGVTVMTTPDNFIEFSRQRGLAADGRCKAFGAGADGTVWSEGVGVLLVERLSDALARGHQVLAVLRGSAVNQDGASNGLTAPNGPSQQRVIRAALASGGLAPADVDVVEAHGTGTALGDPIEAQALLAVYGQDRAADDPVWLGSVKSNLGHTQGAAGVASVIKMVLALRHGRLPATLHADEPSAHVDWSSGALRLLTSPQDWPTAGTPRRAGISSFGVSGTNAHVIIEEAPGAAAPAPNQAAAPVLDAPVPLLLSARSENALRAQAARLADRLAGSDAEPRDVAWSLLSGRASLPYRAVVLDAEDPAGALRMLATGGSPAGAVTGSAAPGKLGVLFTGQGAQRVGMGRGLYEAFPVFAAAFDAVVSDVDAQLGRSLTDIVFGLPTVTDSADPQARGEDGAGLLDRTEFTQPALFAVEVATFRLLESWGVRPDVVIGHSIGELAAAHVAGVLSLPDAARLVVARGRLMQALPEGGAMVAVQAGEAEAQAAIDAAGLAATVEVGAVNAPNSVVLSGAEADVTAVADRLAADGRRARRLTVSHAFHSPLMDPIIAEYDQQVRTVHLGEPRSAFVSTVTGGPVTAELTDPAYWLANVRRPVRFADAVTAARELGVTTFVEVGPGGVLTGLAQQSIDDTSVGFAAALRHDADEPRAALDAVSRLHVRGHHVDWSPLLAGGQRVDLPTYPFQRQRYWVDVAPARGDVIGAGLAPGGHPLLGAVVALPDGGVVGTARLTLAEHPWLTDHTISGAVLLPGAALAELAARVGDEADTAVVEELVIEAPLVLPATGARQLRIVAGPADQGGRRPIAVHSRADGDPDAPWTRHATGTAAPAGDTVATGSQEWPPRGTTETDLTGFYERRHAAGYEYGPAFQGLRRVWTAGDDVYAEVALAEPQAADAARFGMHPALLDAALHASSFSPVGAGERLLLPFAWNGLRLHAAGAAALRVRITVTAADTVTLHLADPSGAPVAEVAGLVFRPVDPAALTAGPDTGRGLSVVDWIDLPPATAETRVGVLGAGITVPGAPGYPDLAALTADGTRPDVVLTALRPAGPGPDAACDLAASTLTLLRSWLAEPALDGVRLAVVTRGAVGDGPAGPAAAAVWGLVRTAQSEHPGRFTLVDLDDDARSLAALPGLLATDEPQLAVRAGEGTQPRLAVAPQTTALDRGLDPNGTVLITGGTGALGGLVAEHLVRAHGVRGLVLASRRGGRADGAAELAARLTALGARVAVEAADVSDRDALAGVLARIPADAPLTAVIHAAGALDDGVLEAQTGQRLAKVFGSKADAAWHLHELTAGLDLAAFVLFSSIAGTLGNAGQANYAAANGYLDGLARLRRQAGLPATALAWSLWDGAAGGMGAGPTPDEPRRGRRSGLVPLPAPTGLALLDAALRRDEPVLVPVLLDLPALSSRAAAGDLPALLRGRVRAPRRTADAAQPGAGGGDLAARLASAPPAERRGLVVDLVRAEAAAVLGAAGAGAVRADQAFKDLGFDSLAAVE
ncbi:type I polyketide synthase, partial [Catellatospora vulcania]|uniref:type I polyketide synthase n=1 Tax=Catellatospora vulcania TaxID=1460450 RepID=UPI001E4C8FC4